MKFCSFSSKTSEICQFCRTSFVLLLEILKEPFLCWGWKKRNHTAMLEIGRTWLFSLVNTPLVSSWVFLFVFNSISQETEIRTRWNHTRWCQISKQGTSVSCLGTGIDTSPCEQSSMGALQVGRRCTHHRQFYGCVFSNLAYECKRGWR